MIISRIYQVCLHLSSQVESNLNSENIKSLFQIQNPDEFFTCGMIGLILCGRIECMYRSYYTIVPLTPKRSSFPNSHDGLIDKNPCRNAT